MSLYDYLRLPEQERIKIQKQERASKKVDKLCSDIMEQARGEDRLIQRRAEIVEELKE
jgi:hypothetical protein